MSNPNANVRMFMGPINAAAYWIGDHLLRGGDIVNDSTVTGSTVKAALNTLSAASSAVFPFVAAGLAEQDLVSYDAGAATWRNRTKVAALKGTGTDSFVVGTGSFATGTNDIILGASSGTSGYSGTGLNIGIGTNVLKSATTTNRNVVIGHNSAGSITSGVRNTVLGNSAFTTVATGQKNVAVGFSAMSLAEDAVSNCVGVGNDVLTNILAAAGITTAVGNAALFDLTSGTQNTALGYNAGRSTTTGSSNTHAGYSSLNSAAGSDNSFFGAVTGTANVGSRNSVLGSQAFNSASAAVTDCVAMGYNALTGALTTGAIGTVAIGSSALTALVSGHSNTAVGYLNQRFIGGGFQNTTLGYIVMNNSSSSCSAFVGIGANALAGLLATGANGAVAVGVSALAALTSGAGNVAVGYQAGNILTTGSNMTIYGYDADGDNAARSGCVVLGAGATATADDTLVVRMGNTSTKEIVVTPVVTSTPVATVSNLPITVGGTSYTIPLGPSSYTYSSVRTSDQVIAVNNTVVDSTLAVTVPAGTYAFSFCGIVTHSTAQGGSVAMRCSTDSTVSYTGRAEITLLGTSIFENGTDVVTAGNTGGLIVDANTTSAQFEEARGTVTCAASTTFTIAVYDSANQNITISDGASFILTKTN